MAGEVAQRAVWYIHSYTGSIFDILSGTEDKTTRPGVTRTNISHTPWLAGSSDLVELVSLSRTRWVVGSVVSGLIKQIAMQTRVLVNGDRKTIVSKYALDQFNLGGVKGYGEKCLQEFKERIQSWCWMRLSR
jgi:hypothetical protein